MRKVTIHADIAGGIKLDIPIQIAESDVKDLDLLFQFVIAPRAVQVIVDMNPGVGESDATL
jgi:hypothetical protein